MDQERTKRKLSGILSADVVGYSRLMQENEDFTIKSLGESKKFIGDLIEEFKGRVVDAPGDNILAEFGSVVNAVDCAVKIQDKLQRTNALLPEKNRMDFRIGVNLGDVIDEDGKIYGDGVNIAARIEGLAKPGTVCISRTAYDQVKSKFKFGYEYLGEHNLKNISEPVSVYRVLTEEDNAGRVIGEKKFLEDNFRSIAMTVITILFLVAAGAIGYIIYTHQSPEKVPGQSIEKNERTPQAGEIEQKQQSEKNEQDLQPGKIDQASFNNMAFPAPNLIPIAVLPFDNLSNDRSLDNFSDGLRDEIVTGLSKHPDLLVTSRDSTFENDNTQQSRESSGVRYILKGKVKWDGNKVRITVQLVEAAYGYILWTEAYDRKINNNDLAIQTEIKWRIFREVRIRLIDMNQKPDFLPVKRKDDIKYTETFHLLYRYYKTYRFGPRSAERLKKALELANELIDIEPDPWVYYMKASILIAQSGFEGSKSEKIFEAVTAVASEAQKLDHGANLAILGQLYRARNDLENALYYYKQWVDFEPGSENAHFGLGLTFLLMKRYNEAANQYELGTRINPFSEIQHLVLLGIAYSSPSPKGFSNLEKAKGVFLNLLQVRQNNFFARIYLTLLYSYENDMENASRQVDEILRIFPFFSAKAYPFILPIPMDEETVRFHIDLLKKAGIPESGEDFMPQGR